MKKINYTCLLLLLVSITAAFGQNNPETARRTPQEQATYEKSFLVNPAKIAPATQTDPRLEPAAVQDGPTNWKPAPVAIDDRNEPVMNKPGNNRVPVNNGTAVVNRNQPDGIQPSGKTVNRRNISGPKTQPEAPKPASVTNLRNQNGSRTQPEGPKPNH